MRVPPVVKPASVLALMLLASIGGMPSAASEEDCPAGIAVHTVEADTEAACEEWPGWEPMPNPCDYLVGPIAQGIAFLEGAAIPGDEAEVEVCSETYTLPRGISLDICILLNLVLDQVHEAVGDETWGTYEELEEDYFGPAGLQCADVADPPNFDPCSGANVLGSRIPVYHEGDPITVGSLIETLRPLPTGDDTNWTGLIGDPGLQFWWHDIPGWPTVSSVGANWILDYWPYGPPASADPCPDMPWPSTLEAYPPMCLVPPSNPLDSEAMNAWLDAQFETCAPQCETSPGSCAYAEALHAWAQGAFASLNQAYGYWTHHETWRKIEHDPERALYLGLRSQVSDPRPGAGTGDNARGEWTIEVAAASAAQELFGYTDSGAIADYFALVQTDFPDEGRVTQGSNISIGPLEYPSPPTRVPPSAAAKAAAWTACGIWTANAVGSAAMAAATGPPGAVVFGVTAAVSAIAANYYCDYAAELSADVGYIKCQTDISVGWGPHNAFMSSIIDVPAVGVPPAVVGPVTLNGHSTGNGTSMDTSFGFEWEQEGYHDGKTKCEEMYMDAKEAARAAHRNWGPTLDPENGTGGFTFTASVGPPLLATASGVIGLLDEDAQLYYDFVTGQLFLGCSNQACPLTASLSIDTTCGIQAMEPSATLPEMANYKFLGEPGCTTGTITVHGVTYAIDVPIVISGKFEVVGPRADEGS